MINLKKWEEIVGILSLISLNSDGSEIFLHFSSKIIIKIPFSEDVFTEINKLVGRKIGILHTDLKDKEYIIKKEV